MTSSLRRKRQITAVPSMPARMTASLAMALSLAWAGPSPAQVVPAADPPQPMMMRFKNEPSRSTPNPVQPTRAPVVPMLPIQNTQAGTPPASRPRTQIQPAAFGGLPQGPDTRSLERTILPVQFQQPGGAMPSYRAPGEETQDITIQLEPPGPQRLFKLESEKSFQERLRQEARERPTPERITFPDEPAVGRGQYTGRTFPELAMYVEPNYLCHRRLYFQDLNSERYGWDLGFVQPFVSAGEFYADVLLLPYHYWTEPCRRYECSAGYCLPGDPVPYLIYPPQLSLTGAVMEAATIVGIVAIFPM